jgi:uncharacterized membrane protein
VNFALFFDPGFHTILFEVIAAIGFGFIILGLLLRASTKTIGIMGLVILVGHNLFASIPLAENSVVRAILTPLFSPGAFPVFSGSVFVMGYPPIPWLGIMLVGFASGKFFELAPEKRKSLFIRIGWIALLLFTAIRFINIYGDTAKWSSQESGVMTFLSFMNVAKYPPSLLFCLITLGIMFLLLAFWEGATNGLSKILAVYGKVPLFYFVAHFFLIHFILLAILFLQGFPWSKFDFASGTFGRPKGVQSGLALWMVYLIWIGVVLVLYKPCSLFGKYKATHKQWWLKYV